VAGVNVNPSPKHSLGVWFKSQLTQQSEPAVTWPAPSGWIVDKQENTPQLDSKSLANMVVGSVAIY